MQKIFVFGSNQAGVHGAGSAKEAHLRHGAAWGCGEGPTGNAYAIPTKDRGLKSLTLAEIQFRVNTFLTYALQHPRLQFRVVAIGCGLAGFKPEDIAPLFRDAPGNCVLPAAFEEVLDRQPALL